MYLSVFIFKGWNSASDF